MHLWNTGCFIADVIFQLPSEVAEAMERIMRIVRLALPTGSMAPQTKNPALEERQGRGTRNPGIITPRGRTEVVLSRGTLSPASKQRKAGPPAYEQNANWNISCHCVGACVDTCFAVIAHLAESFESARFFCLLQCDHCEIAHASHHRELLFIFH